MCLGFSFLFDDTRKVTAYLVDLDILAHSQCGPHSWDKHLHKFLQDTKGWNGIAWGSCWWRRRRGWRRGHTPSGRATAPWSPKQTSLGDRVRLNRGMVRVGSGYATFAFATWTVSFQSDYSFHNWWGCHLLHKKGFNKNHIHIILIGKIRLPWAWFHQLNQASRIQSHKTW